MFSSGLLFARDIFAMQSPRLPPAVQLKNVSNVASPAKKLKNVPIGSPPRLPPTSPKTPCKSQEGFITSSPPSAKRYPLRDAGVCFGILDPFASSNQGLFRNFSLTAAPSFSLYPESMLLLELRGDSLGLVISGGSLITVIGDEGQDTLPPKTPLMNSPAENKGLFWCHGRCVFFEAL